MPGYFRLLRIGDETHEAVKFSQIDDEMRIHFGAPPDPKNYFCNWYNPIGEALAMGASLEKIRDTYRDQVKDEQGVAIVEWLMANFTSDAWFSRMK